MVRIVGDEGEKQRLIDDFCDVERSSPVVATTSRLLSTGVDIEDLKYVVLFRPVGSIVEFKQIIGRGTRLYPEKGKTSFEIIDFVGATSHFADPDFDGYPAVVVDDYTDGTDDEGPDEDLAGPDTDVVAEPEPPFDVTDPAAGIGGDSQDGGGQPGDPDADGSSQQPVERFVVDNGSFFVVAEALMVPDTSSGHLVLTEYGEFVADRIRQLAASPAALTDRWSHQPSRVEVLAALTGAGLVMDDLVPAGAQDFDPFDVLVQLAWNVPARTHASGAGSSRS